MVYQTTDILVSGKRILTERFNADCCQVLECVPAVFAKSLAEDGILRLPIMCQLDGAVFSEATSMYANNVQCVTVHNSTAGQNNAAGTNQSINQSISQSVKPIVAD